MIFMIFMKNLLLKQKDTLKEPSGQPDMKNLPMLRVTTMWSPSRVGKTITVRTGLGRAARSRVRARPRSALSLAPAILILILVFNFLIFCNICAF